MSTKNFLFLSLVFFSMFIQACTFGVNVEVSEGDAEENGTINFYVELDNTPDSIDAIVLNITSTEVTSNDGFFLANIPLANENLTIPNNSLNGNTFLGMSTISAGQIDDLELAIEREASITIAGVPRAVELVVPPAIDPDLFDGEVLSGGTHTATFVLDFSNSRLEQENGEWQFYPVFALDWN